MQVQGVEATARALAERGARKTEQAKAAGVTAQALHTFVFSNDRAWQHKGQCQSTLLVIRETRKYLS